MARKPAPKSKASSSKTVVAKAVKPVRRTKAKVAATAESFVKALVPMGSDALMKSGEPVFVEQPAPELRNTALIHSFNWYNHFFGRKDAKQLIVQYLTHNDKVAESKKMLKVDDREFKTTYGWLARMTLRGLKLTDEEKTRLDDELKRLIGSLTAEETVSATGGASKKKVEVVANRPNVQEIMREKALEASGELEGVFDDFLDAGCKSKSPNKVVETLTAFNVMPQHVPLIVEVWKRKQAEYEEVLKGKDSQLIEAYSHRTKTQLKNILAFIESVIGDLANYVNLKKATKAPRKRKPVPVEKQVSKLKYLKTFKDEAAKLDLVSVHPTKLIGASEAWIYDTGKRKLHHYIADEYSKTFTVKGNTLLGFDSNQSEVKTLRKPNEQLKEIVGSKPAARKFFKDIKAVSTTPNGRFNEAMIILKAF